MTITKSTGKPINERIEKLKLFLLMGEHPLCSAKARLIAESYEQTKGQPQIIRQAFALANIFNKIPIYISGGELIVGSVASKPGGLDIDFFWGDWPLGDDNVVAGLKRLGWVVSPEDRAELIELGKYFKGMNVQSRMAELFDDERLWPYAESGLNFPRWTREKKWGGGINIAGAGLGIPMSLVVIDYEKVLNEGVQPIINEAKQELGKIRFANADAINRADYLKAVIIAYEALIRYANRFGALAQEEAAKEADPVRKNELLKIASTCRNVPANPARDFREAIQSFWFMFLVIQPAGSSLGRFDQFMYPFYKKDKEQGKITDEEVIELLECLRIKDMQIDGLSPSVGIQEKWSGMAKWHNMVIGGQTPDGRDATNQLSYLVLEAVMRCRTPHHTVTLRVHEKTPETLMLKALEVVRTGIGMPAFIGDKSYIEFLLNRNVPLETARDYAVAGCLDIELMGQSRSIAYYVFINSLVFDIFMHNGIEPRTGKPFGPKTGDLESFKSFDDLLKAFKQQLVYFMSLYAEYNNIYVKAVSEYLPDPIVSPLMINGVKEGKDYLNRKFLYENGAGMITVGMINIVDSLAAIKKLVFDDKKLTMKEMKEALNANWQGYEEIRKMCLAAPKYGNDDDYVDSIARDLYQYFADTTMSFNTVFGGKNVPSAISISSQAPGGAITGATSDGRYAGECLADGAMSAMRGRDVHGPTALLKSALKIHQVDYLATLLNMKFHPTALKTDDDLKKVAALIKTYFSRGGKHVQFNVASRDTLLDAQKHPENYKDLIVRVAGYSAYFVNLGKAVQDEIIGRTEYQTA